MPPATRFACQDHELSVLAMSCQLRVRGLLVRQRSQEACSVNVRRECVKGSISMQWGNYNCVTTYRAGERSAPRDEVQLSRVSRFDGQVGTTAELIRCEEGPPERAAGGTVDCLWETRRRSRRCGGRCHRDHRHHRRRCQSLCCCRAPPRAPPPTGRPPPRTTPVRRKRFFLSSTWNRARKSSRRFRGMWWWQTALSVWGLRFFSRGNEAGTKKSA